MESTYYPLLFLLPLCVEVKVFRVFREDFEEIDIPRDFIR